MRHTDPVIVGVVLGAALGWVTRGLLKPTEEPTPEVVKEDNH